MVKLACLSGTITMSVRLSLAWRCSWKRALRGMVDMRIFLGIILGVILTIGAAYLYDASTSEPSKAAVQTSIERRPMVNWDVVNSNWQGLSLGVRNTWNKLATR
jgi:hypothetical protein